MIWFWRLCVSVELAFSRGLWTKPSLQNQISMSSELNSELVLSYKLQTKLRFHESGIGLFMGIHLATSSCVRIWLKALMQNPFGLRSQCRLEHRWVLWDSNTSARSVAEWDAAGILSTVPVAALYALVADRTAWIS